MKDMNYLLYVTIILTLVLSISSLGLSFTFGEATSVDMEEGVFAIDLMDADDNIIEGDELSVEYIIRNVGENDGEQEVVFSVYERIRGDEEQVHQEEEDITISAGRTHADEFVWESEESDVGAYNVEIQTLDDDERRIFEVWEASVFSVEFDRIERNVIEEEVLEIPYEVKSGIEGEETQDIELTIYDSELERERPQKGEQIYTSVEEDVTLERGESYEDSFEWESEPGEPNVFFLELSSYDDEVDTRVWSWEPDIFAVTEARVDQDIVVEGDEAVVDYEVFNTHETEETQEIEFRLDEGIEDTEEVTIEGEDTYKGNFSWPVEEGEIDIEIASEDHSDSESVMVWEENIFALTRVFTQEGEVRTEEEIVIEFWVTNTGEEERTQEIKIEISNDDVVYTDVKEITLEGREEHRGEFTWQTSEGDGGFYTAEISSDEHQEDTALTVVEADIFTVGIERPEDFIEGEEVSIEYTIENTGLDEAQQDIELILYERETREWSEFKTDDVEMALLGGEAREEEFVWETDEGDEGIYRLKIASEDEEEEVHFEILEKGIFNIDLGRVPEEIHQGEDLFVNYTVTNTKEEPDTQDIRFEILSEIEKEEAVYDDEMTELELDPGETYEDHFVWETEEGDGYEEYWIRVASEDDSSERSITVTLKDVFAVDIERPKDITEGEVLSVSFSIFNTREEEDTQDITVELSDEEGEVIEERSREDVSLSPEGEFADEFEWQTEKGDTGEYTIEISSEDDEDSVSVLVEEVEEETEGDWNWLIVGIVAVVIAVVVVLVFWKYWEY